jgi:hypothetical protein
MVTWRHSLVRAIGTLLLSLAMFSIAGGHWAVLQAVAWARMLGEYSRNASIEVAITKTFSGKYPCDLCRKIKESSQKQEAPRSFKQEKKVESFLCAENSVAQLLSPRAFSYPLSDYLGFSVLPAAPPSPPPRVVWS